MRRSGFVLRAGVFSIIFAGLLIFGSSNYVLGAQLEANINPSAETSEVNVRYQKTVFIEYPQGGQVADLLRGKSWEIIAGGQSPDPGVEVLMQKLNDKLAADGSSSRITDLSVDYDATLTGRPLNTAVDFRVILHATLSYYNIRDFTPGSPALVDAAWRGLTVDGPVEVDGVEINQPISVFREQEPEVYSLLAGTEAEVLLMENLIDAEGIKNQPMSNWHFLFDPTGINVDAGTFGLSEEISGFVVSSYTMGESSIREGRQVERVEEATFTADQPYVIRTVQSADSAEISLIGFASLDRQYGAEVFGVSPTAPEGFATTSTGEFPVMIIYGMAGMAGVGAIAVLFISNRKLKKEEGMGQTGIDPALLRGVSTSVASGGYQTVRGEAQLASGEQYEQTRNVYEEEKKAESDGEASSTRGSMPKGWKPS